jgi:hypothetical protein
VSVSSPTDPRVSTDLAAEALPWGGSEAGGEVSTGGKAVDLGDEGPSFGVQER